MTMPPSFDILCLFFLKAFERFLGFRERIFFGAVDNREEIVEFEHESDLLDPKIVMEGVEFRKTNSLLARGRRVSRHYEHLGLVWAWLLLVWLIVESFFDTCSVLRSRHLCSIDLFRLMLRPALSWWSKLKIELGAAQTVSLLFFVSWRWLFIWLRDDRYFWLLSCQWYDSVFPLVSCALVRRWLGCFAFFLVWWPKCDNGFVSDSTIGDLTSASLFGYLFERGWGFVFNHLCAHPGS